MDDDVTLSIASDEQEEEDIAQEQPGPKKSSRRSRARSKQSQQVANPTQPIDPALAKYYSQRYRLFSRYDMGIKIDSGQCESS